MIRVLLVDDNPDHRFLARRALAPLAKELDLALDFAEDGEAGLARVRDARPDLVLLDVKMPRMDGFEALRALRADPATRSLPVVMFSSSEVGADVERARTLGADGYLTKPLDPKQYGDALRRCVREWAARLADRSEASGASASD